MSLLDLLFLTSHCQGMVSLVQTDDIYVPVFFLFSVK